MAGREEFSWVWNCETEGRSGRREVQVASEREDTVGEVGEGRSIWDLLLLNVNLLYQGIEIPPGISFGLFDRLVFGTSIGLA